MNTRNGNIQTPLGVELKKVKIAKYLSEETTAFSAQLWVNGEYIADVSNDGHGGNNRINHLYNDKGLNTRPKVVAFEKWCKEQPPYQGDDGDGFCDPLPMDADFYISLMVDDYEEQQQIKRWCKTKTVIQLKSDAKGTFRTYKRPYDSAFADWIRRKEPELVEILNERFI